MTSLLLGAGPGAVDLTAVNGDPIEVELVGASLPASAGNTVGNGWVARVRFKGMATGQALVGSNLTLTGTRPIFVNGVASSTSMTWTGTAALRQPLPQVWANGQSVSALDRRTSLAKVSSRTRIYECTVGGITATGSNPTHLSGSATGADLVTWLYIGAVTDNVIPYRQSVETAVSSDVDTYFVLDKAAYASDTLTGCTIQSGAYGSSNASRAGVVSFTNSSTITYEKPDVVMNTMPWQIWGTTIDARLTAFHPSFANRRTLDCVIWKVVDSTGAVVLTSSVLTSMVESAFLTGGKPVAEFYQALDISGLSDDLYGLAFEAYPNIGDNAYKSLTDGFGSATPSSAMAPTANISKVVPFRKDAAGTFGRIYAYVDSVSPSGSPVASATAATAAADPYGTISAATAAIQVLSNSSLSRNNIGNHIVRLVGSSGGAQRTFVGFHGSSNTMSSRAKGDVWLTIERDPATTTTAADVAITVAASTALKTGAARVKWSGVTMTGTSAAATLDNQVTGSLGEFAYETWFDNCPIAGASTSILKPMTRMGLMWITNSALTHVGTSFGNDNTRSALKLLGGCTVLGNLVSPFATSNCSVSFCNALGNAWTGGAVPQDLTMTWWAEGTGSVQTNLDRSMMMFNSWMTCQRTVKWPTAGQVFTSGATHVQNLIEVYNATSVKGGEYSADGNTTAIGHFWSYFNSVPGEGFNMLYNDDDTTFALKIGCQGYNVADDRNSKADFYDTSPETASSLRVGVMRYRYCVDFEGNAVFAVTDVTPSQKNLAGEIFETTSSIGLALVRGWTDDKSASGSGLGGGDYRPTTLSAAYAKVAAVRQAFPIDLDGNARAVTDLGAAGALEAA